MTARLDYLDEREIRWLFAHGVPDTAMLEPTPIRAGKVSFKVHLTPLGWLRANRYGVLSCGPISPAPCRGTCRALPSPMLVLLAR